MTVFLAATAVAGIPPWAMPQPVSLSPMMAMREMGDAGKTSAIPDAPASIAAPEEILPLATGGPFVFEPLQARGTCVPRPDIRCTGPDYCGGTPRIYYGTHPCDDDPVLPLYPAIDERKTRHWYQHAFDMIRRKKRIAETIR